MTPTIFYGGISGIITIISLVITLLFKMEKIRSLQAELKNLQRMLEEMDGQAKLILRTDMELNKTQEELDKKIVGLYALQKISRAITTTLQEEQIFKRIEPTYLKELGFEKASCFFWDEGQQNFLPRLHLGYLELEIKSLEELLAKYKDTLWQLLQQERLISSISTNKLPFAQELCEALSLHSFIVAPLTPKEGMKGLFFVGTDNPDMNITEGDEEIVAIMVNQLGQALENARLFEKTWLAHTELEKKIVERIRQLTSALKEVEVINKRKSEFISAVSHELRTPLTSIKGYASILLAGTLGNLPPEVQARLEKINKHSDELTQLVNDLLDISRIESGKVEMKKENLNLNEVVAGVVELLSIQLKEKQIQFASHIPEEATWVWADASQLKRVFINLINNAIKFTPPQGKIDIYCRRLDSTTQIDVTDTGYGIPADSLEKIFEEFYRVENPTNEKVKGSGLGLSLVKHIVEAHGGKIWVKSRLNFGSTFSFTLPCPE